MMQELHRLYQDIPVPPTLKEDVLTYCRTTEEKPAPFVVRYAKPIALAAACVAVLFVSLAATGNLFGGGGDSLPVGVPESSTSESVDSQVDEIPESASTTRGTMMTTTPKCGVTTTTAHLEGTGGDQHACEKHVTFYHTFDGRLIDYVGSDKVHAYLEKNGWLNTYHLTGEEREQINIVHFLKYFGITKQELIAAMGWEDVLDDNADMSGYFNIQYTYREIADALYSDAQGLIDQVFAYEPSSGTSTSAASTDPSATVTSARQ